MPGNFTENYQLNQWEPGNKVHHDDLNEDNRKLDAALTEKLGRIEFIEEAKITEILRIFSYDLTKIDWNDWEIVSMMFYPVYDSAPTNAMHVNIDTSKTSFNGVGFGQLSNYWLLFFPCHNANNQAHIEVFPNGAPVRNDSTYTDLKKLSFSPYNGSFTSGTTILVHGIR